MIEYIKVDTLRWKAGVEGRAWFVQSQPSVSGPPFVPTYEGDATSPRCVVESVIRLETERGDTGAPSFLLIPELCLPFDDAAHLQSLVSSAPANLVVVAGLSHMEPSQVALLEADATVRDRLWETHVQGHYTNAALILFGGTQQSFLQPKLFPSIWEQPYHWAGRQVRVFVGDRIAFAVLICSELLDVPAGTNALLRLNEDLVKANIVVDLLIWIQRNPKRRAENFRQSLVQHERRPSMILVAGSGSESHASGTHGVSGALVDEGLLPQSFQGLGREFACYESGWADLGLGRFVLLRYNVDAYAVDVARPGDVRHRDATAKSRLFGHCQPFVLDEAQLVPSNVYSHINELCAPAMAEAQRLRPSIHAQLERIGGILVKARTNAFLRFLDRSYYPTPVAGDWHSAGRKHGGGDQECRCWPHRRDIDTLVEQPLWLARVLAVMGRLVELGVTLELSEDDGEGVPALVASLGPASGGLTACYVGMLDPYAAAMRLSPAQSSVLPALVLIQDGVAPIRPKARSVNVAMVPPMGSLDAASAERPEPQFVSEPEFWRWGAADDVVAWLRGAVG